MARVFTLLSPGQVNLQHDGPIADEDAIRDDEGKAFIMVSDDKGPYKFKGGVGSQGRVSLIAVDPGSGKVIGPADRKADDKIIKTFIGKAGMQYFEPARETQPGAPGGGASLLSLTPRSESLERKLDEALGLDEAKSERDKIRAQMKRTRPFRPTDIEYATKWGRVTGSGEQDYRKDQKRETREQDRGEAKKEVRKGLEEL